MFYDSDTSEKIKIIDNAFAALTINELKEMFSADDVVARLRGLPEQAGPLSQIITEMTTVWADNEILRGEIQILREDLRTLIRCLSKGMGDTASVVEFCTLKSRHSIY